MSAEPGTIAILAAGASSRMRGGDKCLEEVEGRPLVRLLVERALATGWPVLVTLPAGGGPRAAALEGLPLRAVPVPDARDGMSASFRALAREIAGPVLICLGDMPEIETADMAAVIAASDGTTVARGTSPEGEAGMPILIPARIVPRMADLKGDVGGRALVENEEITGVPLPGQRAVTDLDTPEEWAAWRARRG